MASMLHALLSDKPKVPRYPTVDIEKEQQDAISGNVDALPILQKLASQTNEFNSAQIEAQLERAIPGFRNLVNQGTENVASMLSGELPEDVSRLLKQRAAEAGVALGTSGSQFSKYDELRNLGLTSLDLTQRGLDSANRWIAAAQSRSPVMDITSMFVTPHQRIQTKLSENANIFQRNWLKAKVDAIPEGWEAALITLADNIEEMGSSVLAMYAGGAMGGGGGGGMMGGGGGSGGGGGGGGQSFNFGGGGGGGHKGGDSDYAGDKWMSW